MTGQGTLKPRLKTLKKEIKMNNEMIDVIKDFKLSETIKDDAIEKKLEKQLEESGKNREKRK